MARTGRPRQKLSDVPTRHDKKTDFTLAARCMAMGLPDREVAYLVGVSDRTVGNYKTDEEFLAFIKNGQFEADRKITETMYRRAIGYEYVEETREVALVAVRERDIKIEGSKKRIGFSVGGDKKDKDRRVKIVIRPELVTTKVVTKHMPPNELLLMYWLNNRRPDEWKYKSQDDGTGRRRNITFVAQVDAQGRVSVAAVVHETGGGNHEPEKIQPDRSRDEER